MTKQIIFFIAGLAAIGFFPQASSASVLNWTFNSTVDYARHVYAFSGDCSDYWPDEPECIKPDVTSDYKGVVGKGSITYDTATETLMGCDTGFDAYFLSCGRNPADAYIDVSEERGYISIDIGVAAFSDLNH